MSINHSLHASSRKRTRGLIYFLNMSHSQKRYQKPARSMAELLVHLKARGLAVADDAAALAAMKRIGYYRLLIYMRPLQLPTKQFMAGTTFDSILHLYEFDEKLRMLCLEAIQVIEVALRAAIVDRLATQHGAHFYTRSRHFESHAGFHVFMKQAIAAKYLAIDHYYKNYNDPPVPPIWTVLEAVTFGTLSQMYSQLHLKNRKIISKAFSFDEKVLVSWFRSLNMVRNMCAHHNRMWDFKWQVDQPIAASALAAVWSPSQNRFYARAVMIVALLQKIDPTSTWKQRLVGLIGAYPGVAPNLMGFPAGWIVNPFWV